MQRLAGATSENKLTGQALDAPGRLEALYSTGLMDSEVSDRYDRLTRLASNLLSAPVALVSLVDDRRQFFKSSLGLAEPWASARETPLSHSFCQHVVTSGRPLRIENAPEHPLVKDNLAIPNLGVIAYLGVPIVGNAGDNLGSFCVVDTVPRKWSDEEEQMLLELAEFLQAEIRLRIALTQAELRSSEAVAANHAKSDFLARMSHELRTPLNAVIGFTNVLLRNKDGSFREKDLTYLDRIQKSGVHLLGLINGLLDLAKIESGKLALEMSETELRPLIEEIVAQFEIQANAKGVELALVFPRNPLRAVVTDRVKLEQVLLNLVGNALKFTSHGKVIVQVTASEDGAPESVSVSDSGIGIPPDRVDAIFEAFEQADRTTAALYGGTGLGLPISRALCEMLGYRLDVQSVEDSGSTFTVVLNP
ncbi:MAG: GAF domain-containing sensor histidine kinase [Gemmatimonadaceae bacterium]